MQFCIFDKNKICDNCSDCNICDIEEGKICDNCGKCLEIGSDYKEIKIEGLVDGEDEVDDYLYEEVLTEDSEEELDSQELFIEDIPELREKYYKDLEKIFRLDEIKKKIQ